MLIETSCCFKRQYACSWRKKLVLPFSTTRVKPNRITNEFLAHTHNVTHDAETRNASRHSTRRHFPTASIRPYHWPIANRLDNNCLWSEDAAVTLHDRIGNNLQYTVWSVAYRDWLHLAYKVSGNEQRPDWPQPYDASLHACVRLHLLPAQCPSARQPGGQPCCVHHDCGHC